MALSDRNRLLLNFVFANVAAGTAGGILQLITPLYALAMKATTAEIGMIRGVGGIGFLLVVIPAGFMIDHYGSKRLFLAASFAGMVVVYAMDLARTPLILMLLMGLEGFFRCVKLTALSASFFSSLKTIGIEKAGWFRGAMSIGLTLIGPVVGGYLAKSEQYRLSFWLIILITCIPALLVMASGNTIQRRQSDDGLWRALRAQLPEFRALVTQREIYMILLAEGLGSGCFVTFNAFIVVLVVGVLHLTAPVASTLLVFEGVLFILFVFFGGPLLNRMKTLPLYLVSFALSMAGLVGLSLVDSIPVLSLASCILGLGLGMINLVTTSCIAEIPGDRGKIAALYSAARGLGMSLGPLLGGVIGEAWGIRMIFISFAPAFMMLAGVAVLMESGALRQAQGERG